MNRERKAVTTLALLAVALFGFSHPAHAAQKSVPLATVEGYASQIAGRPVRIACDDQTEGGYVQFDGWIHLTPEFCYSLQHPQSDASLFGTAALAMTHEAEHVALASSDEGLTECTAMQKVSATIAMFPNLKRAYAAHAWRAAGAYHQSMAPDYHTYC